MPVDLMVYVLMSRVTVSEVDKFTDRRTPIDRLHEWALDEKRGMDVGYLVNRKIAKLLAEQDTKQIALDGRIRSLEHVEKFCASIGIDMATPMSSWVVERKLKELIGQIDESRIQYALTQAKTAISHLEKTVEELKAKAVA